MFKWHSVGINFKLQMKFDPKIEAVLEKCRVLNDSPDGEAYWIVSDEVGRFLNLQARLIHAKKIIEIGSSIGYSSLFFGEAMTHTGGKLYTIESHKERSEMARAHIEEAGLQEVIHLIRGHAPEHIPLEDPDTKESFAGTLDMVFLDCIKKHYMDCIKVVEPVLRSGGLIIADNVVSHGDAMEDFLNYMENSEAFVSTVIPLGTGLLLAQKVVK